MNSLLSSSFVSSTRKTAKDAAVCALTTLAMVAEIIPGVEAPITSLTEIVNAIETMKADTEALNQLSQSVLELSSILVRTNFEPNISRGLQQNVESLFGKIIVTAGHCNELRTNRRGRRFFRRLRRNDISASVGKLGEDVRAACTTFLVASSVNIQQAIVLNHLEITNARLAADANHQEIIRTRHLDQLPCIEEARYNHVSRNNAPTCVPGSRDTLLTKIREWSKSTEGSSAPIFWLSGIAGTGKSTIAQSVCKNAEDDGTLGATFFFSHQEGQRRVPNAVFPTLTHQLLSSKSHMPIKTCIFQSLEKNPSAGSQELQTQFKKLILEPLSTLSMCSPAVLVLDALDECVEDGVKEILTLIVSNLNQLPAFLKIFVTSRPESHIADILDPINLQLAHNSGMICIYRIDPSVDENAVRAYLTAALSKSEVARLFPAFTAWSLDEEKLKILVKISDGLFIVAATIVKFILNSTDADPEHCLSILLQDPESREETHSAVNLLYSRILEHRHPPLTGRPALDRFRQVVGSIVLLFEPLSIDSLASLLDLSPPSICSALHRLQSVVAVTEVDNLIRVLHHSFIDFLTNHHACSSSFLVEPSRQHGFLAQRCISILSKLFNQAEEITRVVLSPEMTYATCYLDFHIASSHIDHRNELLMFTKSFIKSQVGKWLLALFHSSRCAHAIPSIKQLHNWVVHSFPEETELANQLKDLKWCVAEFYNDCGNRAAGLQRLEEASDWWSASEKAYLQLCASRDDFLREEVFHLNSKGQLEHGTVIHPQQRFNEFRQVIEELVSHRRGLTWRFDITQKFFLELETTLEAEQPDLSIYTAHHRIGILRGMDTSFEKPLSTALYNLALKLSHLGQWAGAIEAEEQAVELRRGLCVKQAESCYADLANSLHNLGVLRSHLKLWDDAVKAMEEAVELRHALVSIEPNDHRAHLSLSLHSLGTYKSHLANWAAAAAAMAEAVELRQVLFAAESEIYRLDLCQSLFHLAHYRSNLKQWAGASRAMAQAVELFQALFALDKAAYQAVLAQSLHDLGHYRSNLAQWTGAEEAMSQAVKLQQEMYTTDPENHRADLSRWLQDLGFYRTNLKWWGGAEEVMAQAIGLCQTLFSQDPETYREDLSYSFHNLGCCRSNLKQWVGAAEAMGYAVELRRVMYGKDPDKCRAGLSRSLHILGTYLSKLEQYENATHVTQEAVTLRQALFSKEPDAHRSDLAESFHILGTHFSRMNEWVSALEVMDQAVRLRQALFEAAPNSNRKNLSSSLHLLRLCQSELGNHPAAAMTAEAIARLADVHDT